MEISQWLVAIKPWFVVFYTLAFVLLAYTVWRWSPQESNTCSHIPFKEDNADV